VERERSMTGCVDGDDRLVTAKRIARDEIRRRGLKEAAVEVLRQKRLSLSLPARVVRPRESPARLPVRARETEEGGSGPIGRKPNRTARILDVRKGRALDETPAAVMVSDADRVARLEAMAGRIGVALIAAAERALGEQGD